MSYEELELSAELGACEREVRRLETENQELRDALLELQIELSQTRSRGHR